MKNEFGAPEGLSQAPDIFHNQDPMLSPRQDEIHRNLQAIGPEIAAFYLSAVKVLQNDDLETSSYLLAHIAREIEGGLRDVLSTDPEKRKIQKQLKKTDLGNLSDRIGHIASILAALDIDDLQAPIAKKWIGVATEFHRFAHRPGAWGSPRSKETFVPLWREFEDVLTELVGSYFNLLSRLDRILDYKEPTQEIIKTLPNLLAFEARHVYFFTKLDSPGWLKSLKDAGWFDPDRQPTPQEVPDQPEMYTVSPWYPLVYLEKVADSIKNHPHDETFRTFTAIVNDIVTYIDNNQERVMHQSTVWGLIKILDSLPIERLKRQHITFMAWALRWRQPLLVENEIEQTLFPKFLNAEAKELTLVFLEVMIKDSKMLSMMEKQAPAIVKLCDIEAGRIALEHIQEMTSQQASRFQIIEPIESDSSEELYRSYPELLVSFTCKLFRLAKPDSTAKTIETLLGKQQTIFKQIALNIIKHHYENLKHLFWKWQGNPLEDTLLQPELYQLLQTNCRAFDESEIERILQWIESEEYIGFAEDDETRSKQEAYRKREWLSALMETGNKKIVSAYHKYEQINPAKLERPGLLLWTVAWEGQTSPTTIEELSDMSNAQIAQFLNDFKQKRASGPEVPTEEGLVETFEEYVALNPQQFVNDLQPFQGVRNFYQYRILRGLLKAWRDKREFDWAKLLDFIHQLISSKRFWAERHETRYGGHSEWIFAVAELIEAGTRDGEYTFDVKLLPLAEKILLILIEKVGLRPSTFERISYAVVNSDRGQVFSAMVNYALQFARAHSEDQLDRWPQVIKADFTKRLDRNVEPSFEFSFTLGMYLTYLLYLDKAWLVDNIDRIFPKQDEYHWHVAFSGYLLYSRPLSEAIYSLLKEHGHYAKAITSDFCSQQIDARVLPQTPVVYLDSQQVDVTVDRIVREKLVSDIYLGWVEGFETLADETSLIYQLVNSENPNLLSTLIHSFWKKRDDLPEEMRVKVIPTWRALYKSLSQKDDVEKYGEVLSKLSGWVALVDTIDAEVLKWLKMSTQYIRGLTDSAFFVEELLPHATKTPAQVGDIYLGMLTHNVYPYHDQEHIQEIIRALYRTGHTEVADRICNLYGAAGFDFLRALYDENQN
ncbi:hypothetical protein F4141_18645 [Candidatus Poribacteria bacterium]|nr:hypothetical protein [Candidatus Poribacteria bacterium]